MNWFSYFFVFFFVMRIFVSLFLLLFFQNNLYWTTTIKYKMFFNDILFVLIIKIFINWIINQYKKKESWRDIMNESVQISIESNSFIRMWISRNIFKNSNKTLRKTNNVPTNESMKLETTVTICKVYVNKRKKRCGRKREWYRYFSLSFDRGLWITQFNFVFKF